MLKPLLNKTINVFVIFIAITLIMAANRVPKNKYTPYQVLMFEIKANEGHRSWWYKDGYGANGKQAYSIGFGWNDLGQVRRHEIKEFTKDGKVTVDEATVMTIREILKYGELHTDPWKNLALRLYSYNCGPTKNPRRLGKCCGASWGCGHSDNNVRKAHNRRRKFELDIYNKRFDRIEAYTDLNVQKIKLLKSKGKM